MSELALVPPIPLPVLPTITTRVATTGDVPFVDALQKKHSRQLGFFPRAQIEGYIANGWMRIAEDAGERVGYVASRDRYLKRDELGAVFQLCVEPGRQRGLIGATLLKSAFDAAAYGCKLFCCWCAQDLAANRFWESTGFVPIAFRAGSEKKSRVHLFWQKRIRAGDTTTPYWYPSGTDGGALRAGRVVLPLPPGTHWSDAVPLILPAVAGNETKALPAPRVRKPKAAAPVVVPPRASQSIGMGGMRWATPAPDEQAIVPITPRPKREPVRIDPRLAAIARELRDRWMEQANVPAAMAGPKYDVARRLASGVDADVVDGETVDRPRLLAA